MVTPQAELTRTLLDVCRRNILDNEQLAVVPEPYIPYVPESWNGLLVLAEAQNLSEATNSRYRAVLLGMGADERMQRLGNIENIKNGLRVGIVGTRSSMLVMR